MSQLAGTSRSDEPIQTSPIDHWSPGKLGPRGMAPCREFNNVAGGPHCSELLRGRDEKRRRTTVAAESLRSFTSTACQELSIPNLLLDSVKRGSLFCVVTAE